MSIFLSNPLKKLIYRAKSDGFFSPYSIISWYFGPDLICIAILELLQLNSID